MAKSRDDLLKEIDNLTIYERDYDVIYRLLEENDPELFSTILESVIEGDLYWLDLEKILANTDYNRIIDENINSQIDISREARRILGNRQELVLNTYLETKVMEDVPLKLGLSDSNDNYNNEFNRFTSNILHELTRIDPNDSDLAIMCKIRIYNAFISGEIQPDDLFLFIDKYIIPVDARYQIIDSADRIFMNTHNLTEDMMKKIKSVAIFLRNQGGNNVG